MNFQTTEVDSAPGDTPLSISWKQAVAIVLIVIFTLTLPVTVLFKSTINIVSDKEKISTFLHENLLSDIALPGVIKKAMEYEAWLTRIEEPLESRLIKSAVSGIDRANWFELFGYIAPEKERKAMLDNITSSIYSWIDGDDVYPSLTLQPGVFIKNIEPNAENLILWIFKSFPLPDCTPAQIQDLENFILS